jgi:hypothetical protein
VDPVAPDVWYLGTVRGLWSTSNGGTHWHFWDDFPHVVVEDLEIQTATRKLFVATYGRGVWVVDLPIVVPGVELPGAPAASGLHLAPPYPNPGAGGVVLRYTAKHAGIVTLRVHDVRGRLVEELFQGPIGDGEARSAVWRTGRIPAGVYFALLEAGEDRVSRKVVIDR